MNHVIDVPGKLECSCGAKSEAKDRNRFLKRHPGKCSERREFTRKIANGTRCLDDSDEMSARAARWDAIEKSIATVIRKIR